MARTRCKTTEPIASPYLAIHSVDSLEVLTGNAYRGGGGGHFDRSFQPCIVNWHRNLFAGLDRAPAVPMDAFLAVADCEPSKIASVRHAFTWLECAGLDRSVARRGLALVDAPQSEQMARTYPGRIRIYAPLFAQRIEPAGK